MLIRTEAAGGYYVERRVELVEHFGGPEAGALARRQFLELRGHPDQASLDAWRRLAMPHYTRIPRDPDAARRLISRTEVLSWFSRPERREQIVQHARRLASRPVSNPRLRPTCGSPSRTVPFERFADCRHALCGRAEHAMAACRHRGVQLADGMGCKKALTCRYHAWTYGLDGRLRAIPDEHGFPGIDKEAHGLVPVTTVEKHGMVFVTQDEAGGASEPAVDNAALPAELLPADMKLFTTVAQEFEANWKIVAEGFLEGYHIRSTHQEKLLSAAV